MKLQKFLFRFIFEVCEETEHNIRFLLRLAAQLCSMRSWTLSTDRMKMGREPQQLRIFLDSNYKGHENGFLNLGACSIYIVRHSGWLFCLLWLNFGLVFLRKKRKEVVGSHLILRLISLKHQYIYIFFQNNPQTRRCICPIPERV